MLVHTACHHFVRPSVSDCNVHKESQVISREFGDGGLHDEAPAGLRLAEQGVPDLQDQRYSEEAVSPGPGLSCPTFLTDSFVENYCISLNEIDDVLTNPVSEQRG